MTTHSSSRSPLPASALAGARESARRHDGRFGHQAHSEADIDLSFPVLGAEHVEAVLPAASGRDSAEIAEKVSAGMDFRPVTIHQVADQHYLSRYGADYATHEQTMAHLQHADPAVQAYVASLMEKVRAGSAAAPTADESGTVAPIASAPSRQANEPVSMADSYASNSSRVPAKNRFHADSDFVQRGGVADTVIHRDGTEYHRIRPGVALGEFYSIRLQFNRPITEGEAEHISQATGYAWRSAKGMESVGEPLQDSPRSIIMSVDSTKGSADYYKFQNSIMDIVREGSPVRKTNQSGPGTMGTSLVEPIGDDLLDAEIYADYVWVDDVEQAFNAAVTIEEHPAAGQQI